MCIRDRPQIAQQYPARITTASTQITILRSVTTVLTPENIEKVKAADSCSLKRSVGKNSMALRISSRSLRRICTNISVSIYTQFK